MRPFIVSPSVIALLDGIPLCHRNALVTFGGGVAKMSGKLGGSVFAHNKGGNYVRNWNVPTDPGTPAQLAVRSYFAAMADHWVNTLTDQQREDWKTYADAVQVPNRLGDMINLPPMAWYQACNVGRAQGRLIRVDDAPTIFSMADQSQNAAITASEGTQQISLAYDDARDWCDEDDAGMLIWSSRPTNPSINFFKGPFRYATVIEGDSVAPPATPEAFASPFAFVEGQKLFATIRISRADGRYSNEQILECVAAA